MARSVFRSAIDDGKGAVDAGYLGLYCVMVFTMGAVVFMAIGLTVQQWFDATHKFDALMLGQGIGLAAGGFSAAAAAVGAFKRLDRDSAPVAGSSSRTTIVEQHDPAPDAIPTAANPVPVAIIAKQPVPTREVSRARKKAHGKSKV